MAVVAGETEALEDGVASKFLSNLRLYFDFPVDVCDESVGLTDTGVDGGVAWRSTVASSSDIMQSRSWVKVKR